MQKQKVTTNYARVPNELIADTRLSLGARMAYTYLASKPDGWVIVRAKVMGDLGIRDSHTIAGYWNELEKCHWIERNKSANGMIDFTLLNADRQQKPLCEKSPCGEKAHVGKNHTLNNTEEIHSKTEYTPIGTPVPTVNNNLCDNGISSGILQRTYVHAQDGSSSSTGNSHTRTHACAQEKQQEKKIQTIKFDYDGSWRFVGITDRHISYWQEHHPNVDVNGELTRMEMWLITHRDQRKKRIEVFINSWLSRAEQERRNNNGSNGDFQNNRPTGKTERINPEDFATKHIIPSSEQYDEALRRDKFFQSGIIPF